MIKIKSFYIVILLLGLVVVNVSNSYGSEMPDNNFSFRYNSNGYMIQPVNYNINFNQSVDESESESSFLVPLHKILGWTTIAGALGTIGTGIFYPEGVHVGLGIGTTALAVITCTVGLIEYWDFIEFTDLHVLMGIISTVSFTVAMTLGVTEGEDSHIYVGAAAGLTFAFTIGTLYF